MTPQTAVAQRKALLESEAWTPPRMAVLLYQGEQLHDTRMLQSHNIVHNPVITLVLNMKGN